MAPPERRRVVVTGIGAVTPIGTTIPEMWESLVAGRSGVDYIKRIDASTFPTTFGAEVRDFDESRLPDDGELRTILDRKNLFGWVAAADALKDSRILEAPPGCVGVSLGTESRRPDFLPRLADGALYPGAHDHMRFSPFVMAGALASHYEFTGPQVTVSTACTSGTQALGVAYQKIQWGEADAMLSGGCDSLIDPLMLTGFSLLGALSKRNDDPGHASRPFDLHRDGFVLGEGAGMLVLEEYEHAKTRHATIYGEVMGYASTSNAYRLTDSPPDGQGAYLSMKNAMDDAGVRPEEVGYINAHGTSTHQNDKSETAAIKRCFGEYAKHVPISSTKSMMGHLVNAGGAVELIICMLTIINGVLTPTINYEVPDPECDLDYVPNVARRQNVERALSNSFGFGGINATVVVGRAEE
ncbi:MAG TPA: beta-ketoacyl-[acyl-carrier-protein] synthase family protein [Vicinamibacterales bacterium]|jgi:3-oxoacyl-[acyl-carrier-protein] synthase II|nr:beta-ketoacyl-[acyl-carrier-protein] synthase family protein [Vicinamibacterales bacterium]